MHDPDFRKWITPEGPAINSEPPRIKKPDPLRFYGQFVATQRGTNGFAVVSLVFGVLAFIIGPFGAVPAIVFGYIARGQLRRNGGDQEEGAGLALSGLILGYVSLSLFLIGIFVLFAVFGGIAAGFSQLTQDIRRNQQRESGHLPANLFSSGVKGSAPLPPLATRPTLPSNPFQSSFEGEVDSVPKQIGGMVGKTLTSAFQDYMDGVMEQTRELQKKHEAKNDQPAPPPPPTIVNEAGAAADLKMIVAAQRQFRTDKEHFARSLAMLTSARPAYLNGDWINPRNGYRMSLSGNGATYQVEAQPLGITPTGQPGRHLYVDESGVVRFSTTGEAGRDSPVYRP